MRLLLALLLTVPLAACGPIAPPPAGPSDIPSSSVLESSTAPTSTRPPPVTYSPPPRTTPTPTPTTTITPTPPVTTPIPPPPSPGRVYPTHTGIVSTTFWVGEIFDPKRPDGSQVCSTYDSQWAYHWSGVKTGTAGSGTDCEGSPTGGCDGVPGVNKCDTEARHAENQFFPTHSNVVPRENPFYLDLPFDDINDPTAFKQRCQVVPWANDSGYAGHCTDTSFSYLKNRWVKLTGPNGHTCYGQIEDAGPGTYHDVAYVFGTTNARPANKEYNGAGMDVSPALNSCLGFAEEDGENDLVSWSWADAPPPGPWTRLITSSKVGGTPNARLLHRAPR